MTSNSGEPTASGDISPPDLPPELTVEGLLGAGGTARVFRARDRVSGQAVAVKCLRSELAQDAAARERFGREARTLAQFEHAHIVRVVRTGETFVVTELVTGPSLETWLRETGPVPWEIALVLLHGVLSGLKVLHTARIVHRDLKPANILLTPTGVPKIADLGIARVLDAPGQTTAGTIPGTVRYMPPEAFAAGSVTPAWDVHAIGAILHEMVTGRPAFPEETVAAIIARILSGERPRAQGWPGLEPILKGALAPEPAARFPDAATLQRAVEAALAAVGISPDPALIADFMQNPTATIERLRGRELETLITRARTAGPIERLQYVDLILALSPDHPIADELTATPQTPRRPTRFVLFPATYALLTIVLLIDPLHTGVRVHAISGIIILWLLIYRQAGSILLGLSIGHVLALTLDAGRVTAATWATCINFLPAGGSLIILFLVKTAPWLTLYKALRDNGAGRWRDWAVAKAALGGMVLAILLSTFQANRVDGQYHDAIGALKQPAKQAPAACVATGTWLSPAHRRSAVTPSSWVNAYTSLGLHYLAVHVGPGDGDAPALPAGARLVLLSDPLSYTGPRDRSMASVLATHRQEISRWIERLHPYAVELPAGRPAYWQQVVDFNRDHGQGEWERLLEAEARALHRQYPQVRLGVRAMFDMNVAANAVPQEEFLRRMAKVDAIDWVAPQINRSPLAAAILQQLVGDLAKDGRSAKLWVFTGLGLAGMSRHTWEQRADSTWTEWCGRLAWSAGAAVWVHEPGVTFSRSAYRNFAPDEPPRRENPSSPLASYMALLTQMTGSEK